MGVFGGGGEEGVSAPNAKGFGVASIRIFSQKSKFVAAKRKLCLLLAHGRP